MTKKIFTFLTLISLSVFLSAQTLEDKLVNRLRKYAIVYTCSDYDCETVPSSNGQKILAARLAEELISFGIPKEDVTVDDHSYVYATIKGNVKIAPTIFLSAHLDTTPDADFNTKAPIIHVYDYKGGDIVINKELGIVLTEEGNEFLHDAIGGKVITSNGETLLGGDDKAGMAIVMTLAETFAKNPNLPHGDIRIVFTPDEEIGNSTSLLTKENIKADFGLVLDSHGFGRIVVENFNATDVSFYARGDSEAPGTSMIPTPHRIVSDFIANFPKEMAAYNRSGMDGYVDHHSFRSADDKGGVLARGRLRSFYLDEMAGFKDLVKQWADKTAQDVIAAYDEARKKNPALKEVKYITVINGQASGTYSDADPVIVFTMKDSYFNAKEILKKYPTNYNLIVQAYEKAGVKMYPVSSRAGSDACDITYMGIPTYNIFTGSHNEHSRDEWVSSKQMVASYNVTYDYVIAMGQQDRTKMLQEGQEHGEVINPVPTISTPAFNEVYQQVLDKYALAFSNL